MQHQGDQFTERARHVLTLAREEAHQFNHTSIGTEHLLLGLLREGSGVAAHVLAQQHLRYEDARSEIETLHGRGDRIVLGEMPLGPDTKRALELAVDEARRLGHQYVGTEHLLLGLVRHGEGLAAQVLTQHGVTLHQVRVQTLQQMQYNAALPVRTGEQPPRAATPLHVASGDRFQRFDAPAQRVLSLAQEEAARFNHHYIGTEHLLLGLLRDADCTGTQVLRRLGVDLGRVRGAVEFIVGRGDRIVLGEIGLTPRSKKVIELAVDEARRLNHHYIGTEHLLLGLVREGEGIAAGVLESVGVQLDSVRSETNRLLDEQRSANGPQAPETPPDR